LVGIPNQSVVGPRSRSKSSEDSGPSAPIRSRTRLGHLGVLVEDLRRAPAQPRAEPRELARGDEREPLVVRLEDLAALVERVAPVGVVVADARVQHQVVAPAGDRERIELDRPELAEDLEHGVGAFLQRSRRRKEVPGDEEAARGLSGDPHGRTLPQEARDLKRPSNRASTREQALARLTGSTPRNVRSGSAALWSGESAT
jgi:hypothetical protein